MPQPLINALNIPFGLPMCGKGLLGILMAEIWQFQNWIARDQIKIRKTQSNRFAVLADEHETTGTLIPDVHMMDLFRRTFRVSRRMNSDGMPRNPRQAREMMTHVANLGVRQVSLIHLQMTPEKSMERFMKKFSAPDRAGRKDATPEIHATRLTLHLEEEQRTLNVLRRQGVRVYEIDALKPMVEKMLFVQHFLHLPEIDDKDLRRIALIDIQDKEKELQVA